MAVVFFDTSALVKLCVYDHDSRLVAALWDDADAIVASRMALVDVPARLAKGHRTAVLAPAAVARAQELWDAFSPALRLMEVTPEVAASAARLAWNHPLRDAEAIHLASALRLAGPGVVMTCFEPRMAAAARANGLTVVPW